MSRSKAVLPYLVLPADFVLPSPTGWTVFVDGIVQGQLADGSPFKIWDARLNFSLERDFQIIDDIGRTLHVDARGSCATLAVTAASAGGVYREVLFQGAIDAGGGSTLRVRVAPTSDKLAKELTLTAGVYLSRTIASRHPIAPIEKGSRLWECTDRIRLEGGASRLPMYEVPFSEAFPGDGIDRAEFHVEVSEEMELDLESALTVYINSERPDFVNDVATPGSDAERRLWNGIMRRTLTFTALSDAFASTSSFEAGSLGSTLRRWARQAWGDDTTAEQLRESALSNYPKFEARIESWMAEFGGIVGAGGKR